MVPTANQHVKKKILELGFELKLAWSLYRLKKKYRFFHIGI